MNKLVLPDEIHQLFGVDAFAKIMAQQGKAFRDIKGRKTIQTQLNGKSYFIKQHFGVGWGEIFKNLLSFKKPVLGALTEVQAIQKLDEISIATTPLVGYGVRGCNPATQQSFIITQDLGDITSLEDLCADWANNPPEAALKQALIIAIAQLSAKLHGTGLCHRDFYLCHFVVRNSDLTQGKLNLILIDLHRMLMTQPQDGNAVVKDIAGLVFSAKDSGFTVDDWVLFKQYYLPQSDDFWLNVETRANKLYAKFHSDKFQKRLVVEKATLVK